MEKIDQKMMKRADIVSSFAPVIKELKTGYDALQQRNVEELSYREFDENPPEQNKTTDEYNNAVTSEPNEVDDLVQEITENEPTAADILDRMASVLESNLAGVDQGFFARYSKFSEVKISTEDEFCPPPPNDEICRTLSTKPDTYTQNNTWN